MRLENLTWPKAQEYFEKNDMVLVSIGSIECHGRHMPLGYHENAVGFNEAYFR